MQHKVEELSTYTAIDLFAGGGGLTVGLNAAGFSVVAAVEMESFACETYKANHPKVALFPKNIRDVRGVELLKHSPSGTVDLVAGCPPCQGFSSLTSKYKTKVDPRNTLVAEMGRLVEEIKPRVLMMENVPGLSSKSAGRKHFDPLVRKLRDLGYVINDGVLQVADYGVPQSRRRLVLLAGLGFGIQLPEPSHDRKGEQDRAKWVTIAEVIQDEPSAMTLSEAKAAGGPAACDWHVVRDLSDVNRQRLKAAKPGMSWREIPVGLRPPCHQHESVGFSNVYGRMRWDAVAPSITGGCTTLSKGRFGHPDQERTISVREAAMLQTFPRTYRFNTKYMEHACSIIGNALPCKFAEALARRCLDALQDAEGVSGR